MEKCRLKKLYALIAGLVLGIAAAVTWHVERVNATFGGLTINTVNPDAGQPYSAAISPDGSAVAMMHREFSNGEMTDVVVVKNVQSNRELNRISLSWRPAEQRKNQYYLSRNLSYCDAGKYLLAFTDLDRINVLDSRTFRLHTTIDLSDLHLKLRQDPAGRPFTDMHFLSNVRFDCSANNTSAVLAFSADLGVNSIKLFDLDKGTEIADLAENHEGRYQGDGIAISPDGSKVALVTWKFRKGEGSGIELIDTETGAILKSMFLGDRYGIEHQLGFAGENALVIGEPESQSSNPGDSRSVPRGRMLRIWNFAKDGGMTILGWPGADVYRYSGASAGGNSVFGYTGIESYCKSCNKGSGELKIEDARFMIWSLASGQPVARSPKLRVIPHPCPLIQFMGSCTEFQQPPILSLSANGKAVLAFWPEPTPSMAKDAKPAGEITVFHQP